MANRNFTPEQLAPRAGENTTNSDATPERDLVVTIWPRDWQFFEYAGTRRQLEDEGVIPKDFVWPERDRATTWMHGGNSYSLHRSRPEGLKGPMKLWVEGDWWSLRVRPEKKADAGEIAIAEKKAELAQMLFRQSPEGRRHINAMWEKRVAAREDHGFQSFMSEILPPSKKRKGAERGQAS